MGRVDLLTGLLALSQCRQGFVDATMLLEALSPAYMCSWGGVENLSHIIRMGPNSDFSREASEQKETHMQMIGMRTGDRLQQLLTEGEELRPPGGSSEWSCCPSPSRAETVQASGQAGKRPKSGVRTGWRDNISHLHPRKPQLASIGAGCRWWGDDSLPFYN